MLITFERNVLSESFGRVVLFWNWILILGLELSELWNLILNLEKVSAEPASCRHLHHETRPTNEVGIKIDEAPQRASQSVGCHDTSRWAEHGLEGLSCGWAGRGAGLGWFKA